MSNFEIKQPDTNKLIPQPPFIYKYHKIKGATGDIWYFKDGKFAGDHIYISNSDRSGFLGKTVDFKLVDGSIDSVVGPWHANSETLLADTAVDLTKQHATFIVISRNKVKNIMEDVLYSDKYFIESEFGRYKQLAKQWSEKINKETYFYQETSGGIITGKFTYGGC
jgi:hypothetical protein